jgi:hypothetical protein
MKYANIGGGHQNTDLVEADNDDFIEDDTLSLNSDEMHMRSLSIR